MRPRCFEDRLNCCAGTNLRLADDDDDDSTFLPLILCLLVY